MSQTKDEKLTEAPSHVPANFMKNSIPEEKPTPEVLGDKVGCSLDAMSFQFCIVPTKHSHVQP